MSFFDVLILDVALILAPFSILLILKLKERNINKLEENYLIDIVCFIVLFLLVKYSNYSSSYGIIMLNIPLIILYLYKRKIASLFLSIIIIGLYYISGFNTVIILIEYMLYFIIFLITKRKDINYIFLVFLFIKGTCLTIEYYYILGNNKIYDLFQIFISLIIFYLTGIGIIKMIEKINEMISFNKVLKKLEKEKSIKNALFKLTHEVKNPIAVCKGYLSMMDYTKIDKIKKYNKIIESELNRTLDIMDNFSNYTKIKIDSDILDFNYLIKETVDSVKHYLKDNDIKLDYKYDEEEIFINGDYERLKQVIINIIKNSKESIKENGVIKIKVNKNKKSVSLHIKDNGCGISKDNLKKIGELFFSSKEKGCGIGVPISKEIVKLHNGTLKYKSKENVYTEVIIELPLLES